MILSVLPNFSEAPDGSEKTSQQFRTITVVRKAKSRGRMPEGEELLHGARDIEKIVSLTYHKHEMDSLTKLTALIEEKFETEATKERVRYICWGKEKILLTGDDDVRYLRDGDVLYVTFRSAQKKRRRLRSSSGNRGKVTGNEAGEKSKAKRKTKIAQKELSEVGRKKEGDGGESLAGNGVLEIQQLTENSKEKERITDDLEVVFHAPQVKEESRVVNSDDGHTIIDGDKEEGKGKEGETNLLAKRRPPRRQATEGERRHEREEEGHRRRRRKRQRIDAKEVTIIKLLGEGTFGSVHAGLWKKRPVAVKIFKVFAAEKLLENEWKILCQLRHPHIVKPFGFVQDERVHDYRLVMELLDCNLEEYMRTFFNQRKQLPAAEVIHIARQIASAMHYLHSHDIIHFDLKPQNILVSTIPSLLSLLSALSFG